MLCSGPFSGAQDTPVRRRAQREGATWIGSVAKWRLETVTSNSCIAVLQEHAALLQCPNQNKVPFGLGLGAGAGAGGWGAGGLGAPGYDGPSASRSRPEPCSPSIRKRCACGFPQGTAEPLRHASNERRDGWRVMKYMRGDGICKQTVFTFQTSCRGEKPQKMKIMTT